MCIADRPPSKHSPRQPGARLSWARDAVTGPTGTPVNPDAKRVFNPLYRERLFALIASARFLRHMQMRITDLAWARATFEMTADEFRLQPFGVVHGGNIATLIDTATFWACFLSMDSDDDGLATVALKLSYLAPARLEPLPGTGQLIKAGKKLSCAEAEGWAETGGS